MSNTKLQITQLEWDRIEKEFLAGLRSYFSEINQSIKHLKANKETPFVRSQLCLAFVGADTFSRFHRIFQGERFNLNDENEKRFKKWLNTFVFTDENEVYKKHRSKIKCDAGVVYQLRSAFLHFYSFPKPKEGQNRVCFYFGNIPEHKPEEIERKFKERGHKVTLINAYFLIDAILEGFLLQLMKMREMIENKPNDYIDTVLFAHDIVMQEGATTVMFRKKK